MRAIPQAPEVEKAIIGSMLMSEEALDKIGEILRLGCTKELFFTSTRRELFEFIAEEYRNGRPIDKLELQTTLFNNKLGKMGDVADLMECEGKQLPTSRLEAAVASLVNYHDRRNIIKASGDINGRAYDMNESIYDLKATMRSSVESIGNITTGDTDAHSIDAACEGLKTLWKESKANGGMRGISTSIYQLDNEIKGIGKSDLVCFSGLPSTGKSVLILQSLTAVIKAAGKVVIFTMEMEKEEVLARLLANIANVKISKALTGHDVTQDDIDRIQAAAEVLKAANVVIYDKGDQTINWIEAKAMSQNDKGQIDAIAIDYWQLIESPEHKEELKRLNYTSRRLKTLAKVVKAPVFTGSQLNEDLKTKDSKAMIADANILVRIVAGNKPGLVVDKSRNSRRGQFIPIGFNGDNQRFE